MLGRFLEYAVFAPEPAASLDFYGRLGFTPASVGDARAHAYAVVTDGRITLGLHGEETYATPAITFVRAHVLKALDELERLGCPVEFRHLGNDVFNEIGWRDPGGHLLRLIEARTFSPVKRPDGAGSLCGYFQEIALPSPELMRAKAFWEQLGFVGLEEPGARLPHISCTSDSIDIGLYDPGRVRSPLLLFESQDLQTQAAALSARGVQAVTAPAMAPGAALRVIAPEGTELWLMAPDGED